jgi:hypothetical protein
MDILFHTLQLILIQYFCRIFLRQNSAFFCYTLSATIAVSTIAKSRGNNSQQISDFAANTDTTFFQDFLEAKLSDLFRGLGSIPGTDVIKILQ